MVFDKKEPKAWRCVAELSLAFLPIYFLSFTIILLTSLQDAYGSGY